MRGCGNVVAVQGSVAIIVCARFFIFNFQPAKVQEAAEVVA